MNLSKRSYTDCRTYKIPLKENSVPDSFPRVVCTTVSPKARTFASNPFPKLPAENSFSPIDNFVRFQLRIKTKIMENENPKTISRHEKTNAKNLEQAFIAKLIVEELGALHNPNNELIEKEKLIQFIDQYGENSQAVITASIAEQNAVDAQIAAFKIVPKKVAKIMKSVKGQGLSADFIENLQATSYRLNGVRINKNTPDTAPDNSHSVSRRSYAGMLESLSIFSEQLTANPAHNPNEAEYKSPAVAAWVASLQTIHNTALAAKVATKTARNTRNAHAYNAETGLLVRMNALKNYLATILDANDPRLKQLKRLKFVDNTK